jgi:hypothetical protein
MHNKTTFTSNLDKEFISKNTKHIRAEIERPTFDLRGISRWIDNLTIKEYRTLTESDIIGVILSSPKSNYIPQELVLKNCKLIQSFVQFPKGTIFKEITFNDCSVLRLNIYGEKRHFSELKGYNYRGNWYIVIGTKKYTEFFGYNGFCYTNSKEKTNNGFFCKEITCHENTLLYPKDTIIKNVTFDILFGNFIGHINGEKVIHKFDIDLSLRTDSIPTNYLEECFDSKMISNSECEETLRRRKAGNFDVENPPEIQFLINLHKKREELYTKRKFIYIHDDNKIESSKINDYVIQLEKKSKKYVELDEKSRSELLPKGEVKLKKRVCHILMDKKGNASYDASRSDASTGGDVSPDESKFNRNIVVIQRDYSDIDCEC